MSVGAKLTVTLPGDCEVRMTRSIDAPRERVYEAYTRPDLLKRWLGPEGFEFAICDNDVTAGGRYRWLWRNAQGHELGMRGEYLKIVRPKEIVRSEIFEQSSNLIETIGRLRLTEQDGRTLAITDVLFPTRESRDAALAAGMDRGVAASFDRLELVLARHPDGDMQIAV
jgi:uncharacterized protein YndB with AHSA1/START domain